jgi:hypothetical protein
VIGKELRGLLPFWVLCVLAIFVSRWNLEPFKYMGVLAYFFGTAALGALSMGQEYAYHTLPSLLSIPVPRRRIWTVKLAVLAPQLAGLGALAAMFAPIELSDQKFGLALFVLPPLVGAFVAPWLTMLTRSVIAGVVFTFGAIGGSLALGDWIGTLRYGFTNQADAFQVAFMWWSLAGLSAVGAVMGWRTFAGLQAIEGEGTDVEIPSASTRIASATVTRRHPLLTLIAKELRLQQLAIVIAVMWAFVYTVIKAAGSERMLAPSTSEINLLTVLTLFYSLVLPAVIGSLACAEERNIGTLESQLLLPVSATRQWLVKATIAMGLALALAVILPIALAYVFGDVVVIMGPRGRINVEAFVVIAGITAGSLYMSTLARSGIRALVGSLIAFGVYGFVVEMTIEAGIGRRVFTAVHAARAIHAHPVAYTQANQPSQAWEVVPQCAFLLLILGLAVTHYRSAARNPRVLAAHAAILIVCLVVYDIGLSAIAALVF